MADEPNALEALFEWNGTADVLEAVVRGGTVASEPLYEGDYLLHQAVKHFDGAKPIELLVGAGATVDATSPSGLTPLQMAYSKAGGSAVAALVQHGAAIDVVDDEGNSLLHLAAVAEAQLRTSLLGTDLPASSVDVLLKLDADKTATTANGHTPND